MTHAAPLLEARGITKRYGRVRALRGVDLSVESGCSVALLGPNGAGKSTFLRIVAGLIRPTTGRLVVGGRPARTAGEWLRERLGYVSHHSMLYDSLSARENLRFAGRLHGVDQLDRRVDALLDRLDLAQRRDDAVGTFSRGMQQRVALARALLHDPPLLLLDEPFTGLDGKAAEALQALIQGTRRRDRTLLLVTHDVARGLRLADRAVVLAGGRVALDRTLQDAAGRAAFEEEYAAFVLGERPEGGEDAA